EDPACEGEGAQRVVPLRLGHVVVDGAQDRPHLLRDAPRDDHQVRLARRGAESLRAETADVNARGCGCDHLDRAAGEAELRRPYGVAAAPADHLAQGRREDVPAQRFGERLYSQSSPPFFQMWASE